MSVNTPSAVSLSQYIATMLALIATINERDDQAGATGRADSELYEAWDTVYPGVAPAETIGDAQELKLITSVDEKGEPSASGDRVTLTPLGQDVLRYWSEMSPQDQEARHTARVGKFEVRYRPFQHDLGERLEATLEQIRNAPPAGRRFRPLAAGTKTAAGGGSPSREEPAPGGPAARKEQGTQRQSQKPAKLPAASRR